MIQAVKISSVYQILACIGWPRQGPLNDIVIFVVFARYLKNNLCIICRYPGCHVM